MLFSPTPDQEFLRGTTARFLDDKVPPRVLRDLRGHPQGFTEDYWRQAVALGWAHLLVAEDLGGGSASGDGVADLALLAYELGRRAAPGPLLVNAIVAGALSDAGGHEHVVKALLAGDELATWALLDDPRREGLAGAPATLRPDGSGFVLDGSKRPVESAAAAAHLLVGAVSPDGPTQVLVPTDAPGVHVAPLRGLDLTRRFDAVTFDGVRLDAAAVVGTVGGAAADLERQLLRALVVSCAESAGAMRTAFDMTLEWTFDRYSFGRPLASYQAIKHRMASMAVWLEASHAIAADAARAVGAGAADAAKLASAAAAYVGGQGSELLQECVQLHGGIGVTFEHDLHLHLRRHTVNRGLYGTPAEHRRRVAAELEREAGPEREAGAAA